MKKTLLILAITISGTVFAQGGETCASATVISVLPYVNTGNTSTANDDYFESCPDAGNAGGGRDVVYKYTSGSTAEYIDISVCVAVTNYDSQIFVYESTCTGTPYACQEDGCQSPAYTNPYNSTITNLYLSPSTDYYIVVDGYSASSSGAFQLNVNAGVGAPAILIPFTDNSTLLPTSTFYSGNAIGVADMNNDKRDDIIRASNNTTLTIDYQPAVSGMFTEAAYASAAIGNPWGVCVGDYDNDGYNDLLYGDYYTTYILKNNTASSFNSLDVTAATGAGSIFVQGNNFFDINGDGNLDAFVCDDVAMSHIYVGNGAGGWVFDQSLIPLATSPASDNSGNYASIFSDINNDDKCDFFITHCRQAVTSSTDPRRIDQVFLSNGDYTYTQDVTNFTGLRSGGQGWSTDFADFDNDGDFDAFILQYDVNSLLMQNNGSGVFTDIIGTSGVSSTTSFFGMNVVCEDFNNDTWIDMFISGNEHKMYVNNGGMNFTLDGNGMVYGTNQILAAATGDLNQDGKIDIYSSYCDIYNTPSTTRSDKLWLNAVSNSNNYIFFNLQGVQSNRNAIGAKIKLYGPWGVQVREVRSGEAYGIQNSLAVHFGLGAATTIDSAYIIWPSGNVDVLENITANQSVDVLEGSSPLSTGKLGKENGISVYPNPTAGLFTINLMKYNSGKLILRDLSGRIVMQKEFNSRMNTIDISGFANGSYTYEVTTSAGIAIGKIVKQ